MSNSTNQTVASMRVVPVAGQDSMLMNLSGAHGPYFTRNIVILEDSNGRTVIGEVPGGEPIRTTLDAASELVIESKVANYRTTLNLIGKKILSLGLWQNLRTTSSNEKFRGAFRLAKALTSSPMSPHQQ
jgi:glucarate dehydratase